MDALGGVADPASLASHALYRTIRRDLGSRRGLSEAAYNGTRVLPASAVWLSRLDTCRGLGDLPACPRWSETRSGGGPKVGSNSFARLALGGAKRGLGAEAPCWLDPAFAVNCQHEAEAPRPRFAAWILRASAPPRETPAELHVRGGTDGPVAASARPPTTEAAQRGRLLPRGRIWGRGFSRVEVESWRGSDSRFDLVHSTG